MAFDQKARSESESESVAPLTQLVWADELFGESDPVDLYERPVASITPAPEPQAQLAPVAERVSEPKPSVVEQPGRAVIAASPTPVELAAIKLRRVERPNRAFTPSAITEIPLAELQVTELPDLLPVSATLEPSLVFESSPMLESLPAMSEPLPALPALPVMPPPLAYSMLADSSAPDLAALELEAEEVPEPEPLPDDDHEPFEEIDGLDDTELPEAFAGDVVSITDLSMIPELQALDPDEPINSAFEQMFSAEPARVERRLDKRVAPALGPKGDILLGIDLGTTYSCAAVVEHGSARVLASRWGTLTMPSVVTFLEDGRTLVGETAMRHANEHPERTVIGWKRLLGRPYSSVAVQEARTHFAYEIVEGENGDAAIGIDDRIIPLEDVASIVLQELRESAALQLNGRVNRAVITCPAHFTDKQREVIRRAGELAGFYVERVLGEPTSAALHFGIGKNAQDKKVLVYDLGGGTFDVSLLHVNGDTYEVLATGGDTFLGGLDFDSYIAEILADTFIAQENIDPRSDQSSIARLLTFSERAKRELSTNESTVVEIDHLVVRPFAARSLTVGIRREQVEELWTPLVDHTLGIVEDVIARAHLTLEQIDEIVLVGGQSRSPLIQKRVEKLFNRTIPRSVNPDEAIALGAAQYADSLEKEAVTLIDALPMSIGVALPGGRFKKIIERDTRLPAERTYHLHTTRDDQARFEIVLFQGESEQVDDAEPLGIIELDHLPKGPKGAIGVLVTLKVTADCVLEVSARETKTNRVVHSRLATKQTNEELRKKLKLPPAPSKAEARRHRSELHRPKGVWGWITRLFGR
jgi:molecular chaperone DnaK (HSP70)